METAAGERWPPSPYQEATSALGEDSSKYRRRSFQRIRTRNPMGIGFEESSNQQRATPCEETLWHRAHDGAAVLGVRRGFWALVPLCIPGGFCRYRRARRGEVLAMRWSDIRDGRATIARSLTQTKQGLEFKGTKSERPRVVRIPETTLATIAVHRKQQDEFRRQFGPDYRTDLDLLFANPDGTPLKPDSVSATVSLLFRRLKLPEGASLHSLRHTHTSHLLANGCAAASCLRHDWATPR